MWVKSECIPCSYRHGNNFRLSMHMHTRAGEKPFICSIRSKWSTMVHGCMAIWIHGKMDSWQFGFMALWMNTVWIHGAMDALQFGFMALWMCGSLDAWYFRKHPPPPTQGGIQKKNKLLTPTYSKNKKNKNS